MFLPSEQSIPREDFTQYAVNTRNPVLEEARLIAYQIQRRNHLHSIPASEFLNRDNTTEFNEAIFEVLFNNQNINFFVGLKETLNLHFGIAKRDELKKCFAKVKNDAIQNKIKYLDDLFEPQPIFFAKSSQEQMVKAGSRLEQFRLKIRKKRESESRTYLD